MACANVELDIDAVDEELLRARRRETVTHCYKATEQVPKNKPPLHNLMRKQPAVLGSVQVVSGLLSVGVGLIFAVTQDMSQSLFSLFRVSQLTGALFIVSGLVSNALFRHPELLPVSFAINCGCICVSAVAAPLIIVDLRQWEPDNEFLKMELFELCILGLESCLSVILCFWFFKEKQRNTFSPST